MSDKAVAFSRGYCCLSMLFIGIFVACIVDMAAHSPMDMQVRCKQWFSNNPLQVPSLVGEWVNISYNVETECMNPNPYSIRVWPRKLGSVFIKNGTELEPCGVSNGVSADILARASIDKPGYYASSIGIGMNIHSAEALLNRSAVQLVYEQHWRSETRFRFLGIPVTTTSDTDEVCGFEWRPFGQQVGPSQCAPSLEELNILEASASLPAVLPLFLSTSGLAEQEMKKNALFGGVLVVSLLGAVAPIACALRAHTLGRARDTEAVRNAPWGIRMSEV